MASTERIHSLSWDWEPPQQTRTATSARSKQSTPLCAPHIATHFPLGSARSPPRSHSPEPNSPATFFAPPAATSGNTFTCAVGAHTRSVTRSMRCLTRRVGSYQRENPSGANSFFFSLLTYAYGLSESCTVLSAAPGDDINDNWQEASVNGRRCQQGERQSRQRGAWPFQSVIRHPMWPTRAS